MNSKRIAMTVATILLAVVLAGCSVSNQLISSGAAMCVFHASETSYVGQPCDPNGSITLVWDNGTQKVVNGVWNEEARGDPPCSVFPGVVTSGTVVPGGSVGSTVLALDSPTVPDTFTFEGFLSSDGTRLEGMMDTIRFEAKGATTCTCRRWAPAGREMRAVRLSAVAEGSWRSRFWQSGSITTRVLRRTMR